jgi:hypothetical protein
VAKRQDLEVEGLSNHGTGPGRRETVKKTTPHFAGTCSIEGSNEKFVRMMELKSGLSSVDSAELAAGS